MVPTNYWALLLFTGMKSSHSFALKKIRVGGWGSLLSSRLNVLVFAVLLSGYRSILDAMKSFCVDAPACLPGGPVDIEVGTRHSERPGEMSCDGFEDAWSFCTVYLLTCQVRVTVGDSGLCCCVCVTSSER